MVGVVRAMAISTLHEISCIDLHNARKCEKYQDINIFHNHNDKISKSPSIWIVNRLNHITQLHSKLYFTQQIRIPTSYIMNMIKIVNA